MESVIILPTKCCLFLFIDIKTIAIADSTTPTIDIHFVMLKQNATNSVIASPEPTSLLIRDQMIPTEFPGIKNAVPAVKTMSASKTPNNTTKANKKSIGVTKLDNKATSTNTLAAMDKVKSMYVVDYDGYTAWMDTDGNFWFVGRVDDVIKSSGYRIGPFEIESVIMELPYVLECAVTAAPDEIRGQVVKASIVLTKGTVGSDELKKEIQTYVKKRTAPYKYPRIVEFLEELPKTISGKIRRVELKG